MDRSYVARQGLIRGVDRCPAGHRIGPPDGLGCGLRASASARRSRPVRRVPPPTTGGPAAASIQESGRRSERLRYSVRPPRAPDVRLGDRGPAKPFIESITSGTFNPGLAAVRAEALGASSRTDERTDARPGRSRGTWPRHPRDATRSCSAPAGRGSAVGPRPGTASALPAASGPLPPGPRRSRGSGRARGRTRRRDSRDRSARSSCARPRSRSCAANSEDERAPGADRRRVEANLLLELGLGLARGAPSGRGCPREGGGARREESARVGGRHRLRRELERPGRESPFAGLDPRQGQVAAVPVRSRLRATPAPRPRLPGRSPSAKTGPREDLVSGRVSQLLRQLGVLLRLVDACPSAGSGSPWSGRTASSPGDRARPSSSGRRAPRPSARASRGPAP